MKKVPLYVSNPSPQQKTVWVSVVRFAPKGITISTGGEWSSYSASSTFTDLIPSGERKLMPEQTNPIKRLYDAIDKAISYGNNVYVVEHLDGLSDPAEVVWSMAMGINLESTEYELELLNSLTEIMWWTPQLGQRRGQVKRDSRWKV